MERSRVAIVIPAFNEENTIAKVIESISAYGTPFVVDDGSQDNTAQISKESGACVTIHPTNLGYDAALETGFKKAFELGSEIIITVDADGQHDSNLIEHFIREIKGGAGVVIGYRNKKQRLSEHLFAFYSNFCFGIKDPLCGMKAYSIELYKHAGHFSSYKSIGTELMLFAAKNKYKVTQIPITTKGRIDQSRFYGSISTNLSIISAIFKSMNIKKKL